MTAIAVNAATILLGSLLGLLVRNHISRKITDAMMAGIGLFTVYLGITGLTGSVSPVVYLLALILGGITGTLLKLDDRINGAAAKVQKKYSADTGGNTFASGFVGFFLMSCVGAYTIVASFNAGFGDNTMLYTKSVMDFIVSMTMASTLGIGVLFAGIPILLYEVLLVCLSGFLSRYMGGAMAESLSCMGAILTLAIGTNIAGISKIKVVNYIPCLLFAPLLAFAMEKLQAVIGF